MTDGAEFSEDIKQPEIKEEVAQELKEVNDAALRPAEKIEIEMNHEPAEKLQEAVKEVVDAVPTLEAPPVITLEGAGAEGKVTITEAVEPAAIIDSNDGAGIVEAAEKIDPVSIIDTNDGAGTVRAEDTIDPAMIIDTNDGTSTVGIIDTNDRAGIVEAAEKIDPVSIIDSNDGTSREAIGTWPTPENPADPAGDQSHIPPTPSDGTGSVNPNDPTSGVSGVGGSRTATDVRPETVGSHPAELSGFEEGDNSGTNTFSGDGTVTPTDFADRVFEIDSLDQDNSELAQEITKETLPAEQSPGTVADPEPNTYVLETDETIISTADGPLQSKIGLEPVTSQSTDGGIAKIVGNVGNPGSPLPLDDDNGEDLSNDDSDGSSEPSTGSRAGSIEAVEQAIPETGETTLTEESDEGSEPPQPSSTGAGIGPGAAAAENSSVSPTKEEMEDALEARLESEEKNLSHLEEDLEDLQDALKAEQNQLARLQDQLDDLRAGRPQAPDEDDFLAHDGTVDSDRYNHAKELHIYTMDDYDQRINSTIQMIEIQEEVIGNLENSILDKQKEIDKSIQNINRLADRLGDGST